MNLFSFYPKTNFKLDDYDSVRAIDITSSVRIKTFLKQYRGISYFPYVIKDGERPDTVSYNVYGEPSYDWLILLSNDMYSIYDDWPKDSETFRNYIIEKYGSINVASSTIKYYYDANNNIIDLTTYNSLSAAQRKSESELQYEQRLNINKSKIKVVNPKHIGTIQTQLNSILIQPIR